MHGIRLSFICSLGTALAIVLASSLGAPQARAQFVCGGSTDGGEPQTGAGAAARQRSGTMPRRVGKG
jgi:hypothetical protein